MGILSDIDSVIDKADVFINVKSEREVAEILDKSIKFTSVPFDSCHYAILKKFDINSGRSIKKKMVQQQIGTFNWDCTNLLKYYGVDHIFKGANICIKQCVEHGWGNYEYVITKMAIIFRGHKRKNDYAILLNSISTSTAQNNNGYLSVGNYIKGHTSRCVAKLHKIFTDEFCFNELFIKLRTKYHISEFSGNRWLEF